MTQQKFAISLAAAIRNLQLPKTTIIIFYF